MSTVAYTAFAHVKRHTVGLIKLRQVIASFWPTVKSSFWRDVSFVVCLSVVVCYACIGAKWYVVGGWRWYR